MAALRRDGLRCCYTCAGGGGGFSGMGGWIGRGGSSTGGGSSGLDTSASFQVASACPADATEQRADRVPRQSPALTQDFSLPKATPGRVLRFTPQAVIREKTFGNSVADRLLSTYARPPQLIHKSSINTNIASGEAIARAQRHFGRSRIECFAQRSGKINRAIGFA
jgi:hypothetical protein